MIKFYDQKMDGMIFVSVFSNRNMSDSYFELLNLRSELECSVASASEWRSVSFVHKGLMCILHSHSSWSPCKKKQSNGRGDKVKLKKVSRAVHG